MADPMMKPADTVLVPAFDKYVAIDWSGAAGGRHKGISVAVAEPGDAAPQLIEPPGPRGWARSEVCDWLMAETEKRLLVGFDFSFAPPFVARGTYLPGMDAPDSGPAFWAWLDRQCMDEDLGAGSFMAGAGRRHFWMGAADGPKAGYLHWRVCEAAFNAGGGGKASTVFDCVGAAQVAKASFAGMRLLHRLQAGFAIWPFQPVDPARGVVVEIYTRAMLRHAGGGGRKLRDVAALNRALAALNSAPWVGADRLTDHETDVLVSAAALRRLAPDPQWWRPAGMTEAVARTEGWTFGIS